MIARNAAPISFSVIIFVSFVPVTAVFSWLTPSVPHSCRHIFCLGLHHGQDVVGFAFLRDENFRTAVSQDKLRPFAGLVLVGDQHIESVSSNHSATLIPLLFPPRDRGFPRCVRK